MMHYRMKEVKNHANAGIIKDMLKAYDTNYDYGKDIEFCIDEISDLLDELKEQYFSGIKRSFRHHGSNPHAKYLLKELSYMYDTLINMTKELHEMDFDYGAELGRDYTRIDHEIQDDYLDIHYAVLDKDNLICAYGKTVEETKEKAEKYFEICKYNLDPESILCCGYTYEQAVKKVEKERELFRLIDDKVYNDYSEYADINGYKLIAVPDEVWKEYLLLFADYWLYDNETEHEKYLDFWKIPHNQTESIGCE